MVCCAAINCSNRTEKGFRLFRFPADSKRKAKWVQNMRRHHVSKYGTWKSQGTYICEIHFEESQFESKRADNWKKLKPNAVPTLFNVPNLPPRIEPLPRRTIYKNVSTRKKNVNRKQTFELEPNPSVINDESDDLSSIFYNKENGNGVFEAKIAKLTQENENLRKQLQHALLLLNSRKDVNDTNNCTMVEDVNMLNLGENAASTEVLFDSNLNSSTSFNNSTNMTLSDSSQDIQNIKKNVPSTRSKRQISLKRKYDRNPVRLSQDMVVVSSLNDGESTCAEEDSNENEKPCDTSKIKAFRENNSTGKSSDTNSEQGIDENSSEMGISSMDFETAISNRKIRFQFDNQFEYISKDDFASSEGWLRFIKLNIVKNRQSGRNRLQQYRMKKKIDKMKQFISKLEEQEAHAAEEFLKDLPDHIKELITRMKDKKSNEPFSTFLKNFARTLYFYSPDAYSFTRDSFMKCLPRVDSMNKWVNSKDYRPGISEDIIEYVASIVKDEASKGNKLIFNLTFDEMSIKKWTKYCPKTEEWKGLVDLGGQLENTSTCENLETASKALVFMLVNSNGGFKTPVAYYFVNSLRGEEMAILLQDLLFKLHDKNIFVISTCFNGNSASKQSCTLLGANFNYSDKTKFKPYFEHPVTNEPVYCFFAPSRMLKLVRNYLACNGPLYDGDKKIDWSFIKKLNEKKDLVKQHCACKIKNRHIFFQNEKMKVFLAAQVLSNSTAVALDYLENQIKDEAFDGAASTGEFCRIINNIFDILNVCNPNSGVTKDSLYELKQQIDTYINYIEKLEIDVKVRIQKIRTVKSRQKESSLRQVETSFKTLRKSVTESQATRTGFIGLILCLKNLCALCENLFDENLVEYFRSYKLSQDHVKIFFSLIRQITCTNNPTTIQFQSAYKKLLLSNKNVVLPSSTNCIPQDETLLISDIINIDQELTELQEFIVTLDNKNPKPESTPTSLDEDNGIPKHAIAKNFNLLEHDYSK
uniref:THAP-type domain-containing protein n=1 Tax=Clastoptera arizonana TaxID=38151 RepID=A0A1B6EE59_9HEMI